MTDRLHESEQRFRQLFRTAPTAIVTWRPDREVVDWNERAAELFGWAAEEARTIDGLFDADGDDDPMRRALETVVERRIGATLVHPTRRTLGEAA